MPEGWYEVVERQELLAENLSAGYGHSAGRKPPTHRKPPGQHRTAPSPSAPAPLHTGLRAGLPLTQGSPAPLLPTWLHTRFEPHLPSSASVRSAPRLVTSASAPQLMSSSLLGQLADAEASQQRLRRQLSHASLSPSVSSSLLSYTQPQYRPPPPRADGLRASASTISSSLRWRQQHTHPHPRRPAPHGRSHRYSEYLHYDSRRSLKRPTSTPSLAFHEDSRVWQAVDRFIACSAATLQELQELKSMKAEGFRLSSEEPECVQVR